MKGYIRYKHSLILIVGLFPWALYAATIQFGMESLIDEGSIALLVSSPKPQYMGSQFGSISGLIIDNIGYNALVLFWSKFFFQLVSVLSLYIVCYLYFKRQCLSFENIWLKYTGFYFLYTSLCLFIFTKSLSYNHLQQVLVCLLTSSFILYNIYSKNICLIFIGFLLSLMTLNILPSGILTSAFIFVILLLYFKFDYKLYLKKTIYIFIGIAISLFLYHILIKNVFILYQEYYSFNSKVGKIERSYDMLSLIFNYSKSLLAILIVSVITIGVSTLSELVYKVTANISIKVFTIIFLITVAILFTVKYTKVIGYGDWYIAPLVMSILYLNIKYIVQKSFSELALLLFLICIPFIAPFGTNLLVTSKIGFYFMTWFVAIVYIIKDFKSFKRADIVICIVVVSTLWNIQVVKYTIDNIATANTKIDISERMKKIYIKEKQKIHFEGVAKILKENGFNEGDKILAFQPDLLTVFAVGGVPGSSLYFVPSDYLTEEHSDSDIPHFIILNEYSYEQIKDKLYNYGFPNRYTKINIGSPETDTYFNAHKDRMLFYIQK